VIPSNKSEGAAAIGLEWLVSGSILRRVRYEVKINYLNSKFWLGLGRGWGETLLSNFLLGTPSSYLVIVGLLFRWIQKKGKRSICSPPLQTKTPTVYWSQQVAHSFYTPHLRASYPPRQATNTILTYLLTLCRQDLWLLIPSSGLRTRKHIINFFYFIAPPNTT